MEWVSRQLRYDYRIRVFADFIIINNMMGMKETYSFQRLLRVTSCPSLLFSDLLFSYSPSSLLLFLLNETRMDLKN